jgi:lysyl-tRNA synthetase class 2
MLRRFIPTVTRYASTPPKTVTFRAFVTSSSTLTVPIKNRPSALPTTPRKMSAPEQGGTAENLRPDPVTGEMISKSELKRREKQRAKDAAKAEKKAAAPAPAAGEKKEKDAKNEEEEMDAGVGAFERVALLKGVTYNDNIRFISVLCMLAILCRPKQEDPGLTRVQDTRPVPSQVPCHPVCSQLYRGVWKGRCGQGRRSSVIPCSESSLVFAGCSVLLITHYSLQVSLAGRLGNMRSSGNKLHFYDLHSEGTKVQILAQIQ